MDSGIGYNVMRVPIGGTDFSTRGYTYNDAPVGDFQLSNFSLSSEDTNWKIPFIQAAIEMSPKPIKLFGSAWSAPPWMKTNSDYNSNGLPSNY